MKCKLSAVNYKLTRGWTVNPYKIRFNNVFEYKNYEIN